MVAQRRHRPGCCKRFDDVLNAIPVLPVDMPADVEYSRIRCELELAGQSIGGNGLLIAAHARALSLILVTANTREFFRVSDLQVENWL